jgi:oligoendopeptidase F
VPSELRWRLEELYPSPEAVTEELRAVEEMVPSMEGFRGRLQSGAAVLRDCLALRDRLHQAAAKLVWYTANQVSSNMDDRDHRVLRGRASALMSKVRAALSFIEPELLSLTEERLASFLRDEPALGTYRFYLMDLAAQRPHRLGVEAEKAVATLSGLGETPYRVWRAVTGMDARFDRIEREGDMGAGGPSLSTLSGLMQSPDRKTREAASASLRQGLAGHKHALAACLAGSVQRDVALARIRGYRGSLDATLKRVSLPRAVFTDLLAASEQNSSQLRRYMAIRRQVLGVAELMPYDLSAPLSPLPESGISPEAARAMAEAALAPLGPAYHSVVVQAFSERWIDWVSNRGKAGAAYCSACYGQFPAILLNWRGRPADVFTMIHELGHGIHCALSERSQPYVYSKPSVLLGEVASTTNELLLARHLWESAPDPLLKRFALERAVECFVSGFYWGAITAAFQLEIHLAVESGGGLTHECITEMMCEILERWFGDSIVIDSDGLGSSWAQVPHHYFQFYSYQYAIGVAVAASFTAMLLDHQTHSAGQYLGMLRAGASDYPDRILLEASVDLSGTGYLGQVLVWFDRLLTDLEQETSR